MNLSIKIFLTYAGISMFAGLCLMLGDMGGLIHYHPEMVIILWIGPIMLLMAIGGTILLWKMWTMQ